MQNIDLPEVSLCQDNSGELSGAEPSRLGQSKLAHERYKPDVSADLKGEMCGFHNGSSPLGGENNMPSCGRELAKVAAPQHHVVPPPPSSHVLGDVVSVRADGNAITLHFAEIKSAKAFRDTFPAELARPSPSDLATGRWLPIAQADKTINHVTEFTQIGLTLKNSDTFWVRDEDGRVYQAAWSEGNNGRDYWWDWEGESPVDPVEFMPHPLDPRFATTEGST